MATLQVFTVFDEKAGAFLRPFLARSRAEALRMFQDTCRDDTTLLAKHPEDFTLFLCGSFDELTGAISGAVLEAVTNGLVVKSLTKEN